jgi:small subunit ribosomal protein S9
MEKKITHTPKKNAPLGHGVGRRKAAIARVWLRRGSGKIVVNDKQADIYFQTEMTRADVIKPFALTPMGASYDVFARVCGGGLCGQAGAVRLGIARALLDVDANLRPVLRQNDLLTVDSRNKERKKYGQKAARRKFQFVKR